MNHRLTRPSNLNERELQSAKDVDSQAIRSQKAGPDKTDFGLCVLLNFWKQLFEVVK